MTDHGLLFKMGDDYGAEVRVPVDEVAQLADLLGDAPGGQEGSPTAHEAKAILDHAVLRRDEVRHWVLTDAAVSEILWAISRHWATNPLPDGLRKLRDALTDYADRREDAE